MNQFTRLSIYLSGLLVKCFLGAAAFFAVQAHGGGFLGRACKPSAFAERHGVRILHR